MITKHSLQVTYDKLQIEYKRISDLILKLPRGSRVRNRLSDNLNNTQGRMEMLQELVKETI